MPWEAVFWCGAAIFTPALASGAWSGWKPKLGAAGGPLEQLGPWLHGVGPAFVALIRGAILSRDAGLRGHDLLAWLAGGLAGAAVVALCALGFGRNGRSWPDPLRALADEPRWALYRAAGALWLGSHPLGTGIGLGLAALEWGLHYRPWGGRLPQQPGAAGELARLACSSLVFLLTRNFWLTSLAGVVLLSVLRRGAPARAAERR